MDTLDEQAMRKIVTRAGLGKFFDDEIMNERNGGISPATLESAVDSLLQAPYDVLDGWLGRGEHGRTAAIWLAQLILIGGRDYELRDLRRG